MSLQNTSGIGSKDQLSFYSNNQNFLGVFDMIKSCSLILCWVARKMFNKNHDVLFNIQNYKK